MIVSCPSCGTRYHHHSQTTGEAAAARCSHCDDVVPLVLAGRPYLILPTASTKQAGMTIGMDDPQLADQLTRTALDGGADEKAEALTYRVADAEPATDSNRKSWIRRLSGTNGSAPAIFDKRRSRKAQRTKQQLPEEAAEQSAGAKESSRRPLEVIVSSMLMVVGGATAYFSATEQGLDPLLWVATGGGLGLFMAWICLKWTRQH